MLSQDGTTCIQECPTNSFVNSTNSQCQPCSGSCVSFTQDSYLQSVFENLAVNSIVATVQAMDLRQTGNPLLYEITVQDDNNLFSIDPASGSITLQSSLDFETRQTHTLTITALGFSGQSATATVLIFVTDVNDNAPSFTQPSYTGFIIENRSPGTSILRVSANDSDSFPNNVITYSLLRSSEEFLLNASTGELTTQRALDFETTPSYSLTVIARDSGIPQLSSTVRVFVQVIDENDVRPRFSNSSISVQISELASVGSTVIQVQASDPDTNNLTYILINGGEGGSFEVNIDTGIIFLTAALDFELRRTYSLVVMASDGVPNSLPSNNTITVVVQVVDENDNAPSFSEDIYMASILENALPASSVLTLSANDSDSGINAAVTYSIVSTSPEHVVFSVNPSTGVILTSSILDAENQSRYEISVTAMDRGSPPLSTNALVVILVTDVNDNPPIFRESLITMRLSEDFRNGSQVAVFEAMDADSGSNAQLMYRLEATESVPFSILDPSTGIITLTNSLDFEVETQYQVAVIAFDLGSPSLSATASLIVQVTDVNDNPPIFAQEQYSVSISEMHAVGSSVLEVTATDSDSGDNAVLSYMITAGNINSTFRIDNGSGVITSAKVVDFEQISIYRLSITARNYLAANQLVNTVNVVVQVLEVNEFVPSFPQDIYEHSIVENQPAGTSLISVRANDMDGGPSGQLSYQITSGNGRMSFEILNNGTLLSLVPLDREQQEIYELTVMATDEGIPPLSGSTQVRITVLDLNDSPPQFLISTSYMATLSENVGAGTDVSITPPLRVTDADDPQTPNSQITFSIVSGDPEEIFSINTLTGQVQSAGNVDFERVSRYELTISASDSGDPPLASNATIIIDILDQNDNPPLVSGVSSRLVFVEGQERLHVLPNITVSDSDTLPLSLVRITLTGPNVRTGQIGTLSLGSPPTSISLSVSEGGRSFQLTGSFSAMELTSFIRTSQYLNSDNEPDPSTRFIALQIADGEFQTNVQTEVAFHLINDNAPSLDLDTSTPGQDFSTIFTEEGAPVGIAGIGMVAISDRDNMGGIESVNVSLIDAQSDSSEGLLIAPLPSQLNIQRLNNNQTLVLSASAPPASFELVQSILSTIFYFNSANEPAPPLTRTIQVTVSDGELSSPIATTTINITLTNDAPLIALSPSVDYFVNFIEDGGAVLLNSQLTLSDSDNQELRNASVSLVDAPDGSSESLILGTSTTPSLQVSSSPHSIRIQGPASLEDFSMILSSVSYNNILQNPNPLVRRVVFTVDDGMSSSVATAFISFDLVNDPPILDINGPSVGFNLTVTFSEGSSPIAVTSSELILNDVDSALLEYAVIQLVSSPDASEEGISISSVVDPVLTVVSSPTLIQIRGSASASAYTAILSSVRYFNNAEEPTEGDRIIHFTVNDGESNSTVVSSIVIVRSVNDAPLLLLNNGSTYEAVYVEETSAVLIVDAREITLLDNDNTTLSYLLVVLGNLCDGESEILGYRDPSSDRSLNVQSSSGSEQSSQCENSRRIRFQFSEASSIADNFLALISSFTYRSTSQEPTPGTRTVTITISDGIASSSEQHSTIDVILLNDNAPVFQRFIYQSRVRENVVDVTVTTVVASDLDSSVGPFGDQGRIMYQIISGNEDNTFRINSATGEIIVSIPQDRESGNINPVLTVQASNPESLANPSAVYPTTLVIITVEDVNDNSPQFLSESYSFQITEHAQLGTLVGTVMAVDADVGSNSEVEYAIARGNINSVFAINPNTGEITVTNSQSLDRESTSTFLLSVTATDGGSPQTSNTSLVTIQLQDINDNAPIFSQNSYSEVLSELAPVRTSVLRVSAVDADIGTNSDILYTLNGTSLFAVDSSSGVVSTTASLDRESQTTHTFTIMASDTGNPSMSALAPVMVTLQDENDNPPTFQEPSYSSSVFENTALGQLIITAVASDLDTGSNAAINYSLEGTVTFDINPTTGAVTVGGSLDREQQDNYAFQLTATDGGLPARSSSVTFNVTVLDVNDNAPMFQQSSYSVQIPENVPLLHSLVTIRATDNDIGSNAAISFTFAEPNDLFRIDSSTGEVFTIGSIDFEQLPTLHIINIIAADSGMPSLTSRVTLTVNVTDENDNSPVFEQPEYSFFVTENLSPHTIGTLLARDQDQGSNADIMYSISGLGVSTLPVSIDSITGELSSTSTLDRENISSYNFSVMATDMGTPPLSSTARVFITVEDRNDNDPIFSQGSYLISRMESLSVGSTLLSVVATDADIGLNGNVTYRLLAGNSPGLFELDRISGVLTLIRSLDAETALSHTLEIQALDAGIPVRSAIATIQVTVTDTNDEPVQLTVPSTLVSYVEEASSIAVAPDIMVTDGDVVGLILNSTVELIGTQSCCSELLLMDGVNTQFPNLSFQLLNSNNLLLIRGPTSPSTMTQALMSVLYVNMNPEPQPGSLTARITTTDGIFRDMVDITVSVTTINDNAPVVNLNGSSANFSTGFTEGDQSISVVGQVTITDGDSGPQNLQSLVVSLLNEQDGDMESLRAESVGSVRVFPSEGQVLRLSGPAPIQEFETSLSSLQYANTADNPTHPLQRVIEVIASDGQFQSEASFAIVEITAVNDPPTLLLSSAGNFSTSFRENGSAVRLSDTNFMLLDPDSLTLQSASITILNVMDIQSERISISSPTSPTVVRVSESDIMLMGPASIASFSSALQSVSYSNNATNPMAGVREIEFTVSDGDLSVTTSAFVRVEAVNDAPVIDLNGPLLSGFSFTTTFVEEGPSVAMSSNDASIADTDDTNLVSLTVTIQQRLDGREETLSVSNDNVTEITSSYSNGRLELRGQADISTYTQLLQSIRYINSADEPSGTSRLLEVVCSDGELQSQTVIAVVEFSFRNDAPIVLLDGGVNFSTDYRENSPAISILNARSAGITDVDSTTLSHLTLVVENMLDGEMEGLNFTDPAGLLMIDMTESQDQRTATYNLSYPETMPVSTFNQLLLSTEYLNAASEPNASLPRVVTVVVSDGELTSPPVTSTITIRLIDDNEPLFTEPLYVFNTSENTPRGTLIGSVSATDLDIGDTFLYQFMVASAPFTIDSMTGTVSVSGSIDREAQDQYVIAVQLTRTTPPFSVFSDQSVVVVNILDFNDNAPTFNQTLFSLDVAENAGVGSTIAILEATDSDTGTNAVLVYSLVGTSAFQIDTQTGGLSVAQSLNREATVSYQFTVSAVDSGTPQLSSSVLVTVSVSDVNDEVPQFLQPSYLTQLVENTATGTSIIQLSAQDGDIGSNAQISFSLQPMSSLFVLDPRSGVISTTNTLNPGTFNFTATAEDSGTPPLNSSVPITIEVISFNSTLPFFSQPSYEVSIVENSPQGVSILTVSATDPIIGGSVSYSLSSSAPSEVVFFSINSATGLLITSSSPLNREQQDFYQLQVSATSSDGERVGVAQLNIRILDANDFAPSFTQPSYSFNIVENNDINSILGAVLAIDLQDIGSNAEIVAYSTSNTNFIITPAGIVLANVSFDREARDTYLFSVFAIDGGSPPQTSSASATVSIVDENDEAPIFSEFVYQGRVAENQPTGTSVLTVSATDNDLGSNALISYSTNSTTFSVHPQSGVLSTLVSLDYETVPTRLHEVTVMAVDGGSPVSLATEVTVFITVLDIDDSAPIFSMATYSGSILEEQTEVVILQVIAMDTDSPPNNPINFTIISGDMSSSFGINASGFILAVQSLDREVTPRYTLTVQASNFDAQGSVLSSTAMVTIAVLDVNDNAPIFLGAPYNFSVSEAALGGAILGTLSATDDDVTSNANIGGFRITEGNEDGIFLLDSQSGILHLSSSNGTLLNREMVDRYFLRVTVSDNGSPPLSSAANITVTVMDVNDEPPTFNRPSYTVSVNENSPLSTTIFSAREEARDGDIGSNAQLTFSLLDSSGDFTISASGVVTVAGSLDFEVQQLYTLIILAVDGGVTPLTGTATLQVNVLDQNDLPLMFVPDNYVGGVFENSSPGMVVLTVLARDPDTVQGNPITYSIRQSPENQANQVPFAIDSQSGAITVAGSLDRESVSMYIFQVLASDIPGTAVSATVTIDVLDINDNAPQFTESRFQFQISESSSPILVISQLSATDRDVGVSGEVVQYALDGAPSNFVIDPDNGTLLLVGVVDFESVQSYTFRVNATDGGTPDLIGQSDVTITVTDFNDNAPEFSMDRFQVAVSENRVVGSVIFTASAQDADSGLNGQFLFSLTEPSAQFEIDSVTGQVRTLSTLFIQNYTIMIQARDRGVPSLSSVTTLMVQVTDANENPEFSQESYTANIPEDRAVNSFVIQVIARDSDTGSNSDLTYSISPQNLFNISTESGRVTVTQQLDFENQQTHTLTVFAADAGIPPLTASATLTIHVTDTNDNSPVFSNTSYSTSIRENVPINTPILVVNATDADSTRNAILTYSIIEDSSIGLLAIDSITGSIFIIGQLDYESLQELRLVIQARDGGTPSRTSSVGVTITLTDVDDNPPVFSQNTYLASASEGLRTGMTVLQVSASDADMGANADIRYMLANASSLPFGINIITGAIFITTPGLDYETINHYPFAVEAVNPSSSLFTASASVSITILDSNDNHPVFNASSLEIVVSEASPVGTSIGRIMASDADSGNNSLLLYSISPPSTFVSVRSTSGEIRIELPLDFESTPILDLTVIAMDSGVPSLSVAANLRIIVLNANDETPTATSNPSQFTFHEDSPPVRIGSGIALSDPDALQIMSATVQLFLGVVGATPPADDFIQLDTSQSGSRGLTLSATSDFINITGAGSIEAYRSVLSGLQFGSTAGEPMSRSRLVQIQVSDGRFTSDPLILTIAIQLINDNNPVLDLSLGTDGLGYSTSFREGGIFIIIAGPDLSLTDLDDDMIHSVTVNFTNPVDREERLGSFALGAVQAVSRDYGLELVGPAVASEFVLALQTVFYENSAIEPSKPQQARLVEFIASDGERNSLPAIATITILLVNDAPAIRLEGGTSQDVILVYSESEASLSLVSENVTISDVDSELLSFVNVTITDFLPGIDDLVYSTEGYNITVQFLSGTLLLSGPATPGDFSAVLQTLHYTNAFVSGDQLDQLQSGKSIQFSVSDGSLTSQIATAFITFAAVNDPPIIDLNGPSPGLNFATTFTEGNISVAITSPLLTLVDVDSTELHSVSVQLTNVQQRTGEVLSVIRNIVGIVTAYNSSTNLLTIEGPSPTMNFELVLRSLVYQNSVPEPIPGVRMVTIMASDGEDSSNQVTSTITVIGVNDPPVISLQPSGNSFVEEAGPIQLLGRNSAEVSDSDSQILSSLMVVLENISDREEESIFTSAAVQGSIMVRNQLREHTSSFIFSFIPESLGTTAQFTQVLQGLAYNNTAQEPTAGTRYASISVSDSSQSSQVFNISIPTILVNDNPPVFADRTVQIVVPEDVAIQTSVFQASATDNDADSVLTYLIEPPNSPFTISQINGTVFLSSHLDRERQNMHSVTITATDGANTAQMMLRVEVIDINDNVPQFTMNPFRASIDENSPPGTFVVTLLANDADEGSNSDLRFSIREGNAQRIFTINSTSGVISTSGALDFELTQFHSLSVMVQDSGSPQLSNTSFILITINDLNDNPPVFNPTQVTTTLAEDTPIATTLYSAQATDVDTNSQIMYTLVNGSSELFSVSQGTGQILLVRSLDYESETLHVIGVEASDGLFSSTFVLTLGVSDVDDNKPTFIQNMYSVSIAENLTIGSDILEGMPPLMVMDPDSGSNAVVQFRLESGDAMNQFALNTLSTTAAELILAGGLDREMVEEYSLTIIAQNPTNPLQNDTAALIINIIDINDSPPVFDTSVYNFSAVENLAAGTSIGQVSSMDADLGTNGQIQYNITSGDSANIFDITQSGDIVLMSDMLDYETNTQFILLVQAVDQGFPPMSASSTVIITVVDANDNRPIFTQNRTLVDLSENSPPFTTIATLLARDQDSGSNGEVRYLIHPDNTLNFIVNSVTGILTTSGNQLDFESDPREMVVKVIARDNGSPPLSSEAQVLVTLQDVNEFAPAFIIDSTVIPVVEDIAPFTIVLDLNATDSDGGDAGVIEFAFLRDPSSLPFAINNRTGQIFTTTELDRETTDSYQIAVRAFNPRGIPSLITSLMLTFTIEDSNDNIPSFTQNEFSVAITTNHNVGDVVLIVNAIDADIGTNGAIRYSLNNADDQFNISSRTGAIVLASTLRNTGSFDLVVVATDGGNPPLSSNVSVTINIIQPLQVTFNQQGAGFLLNQVSPTTQSFGFFVDSPLGSGGVVSATLGNVTANASYNSNLSQAASIRGVVLSDQVWHDQPEISVVVQVQDAVGDVHCSATQVVITILPDTSLRGLADLNPQVS